MQDIYQEFIIQLYKNPKNHGSMENPDYKSHICNKTCGDCIDLFLKVENGIIIDAKFIGQGCAISQASTSLVTEYLKDRKLEDVRKITSDDILSLIRIDLSKNPSRMKCALLPLDALRKALKE